MRQFNLRLFLLLASIGFVSAVGIYFLHRHQVRKNARFYLEMAEKTESEAIDRLKEYAEDVRDPTKLDAARKALETTSRHYRRYLRLMPEDVDAREKHGRLLLNAGAGQVAFDEFERALRVPADKLTEEQVQRLETLRELQVDLAINLQRYSDAVRHLESHLVKTSPTDQEKARQAGFRLKQAGCYQALDRRDPAKECYEKAIALDPTLVEAYFRLALMLRQRASEVAAADAVIQSMLDAEVNEVKVNQTNPMTYVLKAQYALADRDPATRKARWAEADAAIQHALRIEPDNADALWTASRVATTYTGERRDLDGVRTLLRRRLANRPEPFPWYQELVEKNPFDGTAASRESAIELLRQQLGTATDPDEIVELKWLLADFLFETSATNAEAIELADQLHALNLAPLHPALPFIRSRQLTGPDLRRASRQQLNLAGELAYEGLLDEARGHLKRGMEVMPDAPVWYLTLSEIEGVAMRASGRGAQIAILRKGLEAVTRPDAVFDLKWKLADLLLAESATAQPDVKGALQAEADALIEEIKLLQPDNPRVKFLEASQYVLAGDWRRARDTLTASLTAFQSNTDLVYRAHGLLGQSHFQLGDADLRVQSLQRVLEGDRTNRAFRYEYAEALRSVGRLTEALEQYRQALGDFRQLEGVAETQRLLQFATALLQEQLPLEPARRNFRELEDVLAKAEEISVGDANLAILRAEVCLLKDPNNLDHAEEILRDAMDVVGEANQLLLREAIATVLLKKGDYEGADKQIEEIERDFTRTDGELIRARLARLNFAQRAGRPEEIDWAALESDIKEFPPTEQARLLRSLVAAYRRSGDLNNAVRLGKQVLELQATDIPYRLEMLDLALAARDLELVKRLVEEVQAIDPNSPTAIFCQAIGDYAAYRLGDGSADDRKKFLDSAERHLQEVGRQRPSWGRVPMMRAEIAAERNDGEAMINFWQQAVNLGVRDSSVIRRLATALMARGRMTEADQTIRRLQDQQQLSPDVGRLASEISLNLDDFDRALRLAQDAAAASTNYIDYVWLGQLELASAGQDEQRLAQAIEHFRTAIELQRQAREQASAAGKTPPQYDGPEAWLGLIRMLVATNAVEEVEQALAQAKELVDSVAYAQCLNFVNRDEEAGEVIQSVLAGELTAATRYRLVDYFLAAGKPDEAKKQLEEIAGASGGGGDAEAVAAKAATPEQIAAARRSFVLSLLRAGTYANLEEARTLIDANIAEAQGTPNVQDLRLKADLYRARPFRKDRQEAIRTFEQLARITRELTVDERFALAQLYWQEGDWLRYNELMLGVLTGRGADAPKREHFASHVNVLLYRNEIGEARRWAEIGRAALPSDLNSTMLEVRTLLAGDAPRAEAALQLMRRAIADPNVAQDNVTAKTMAAVSVLEDAAVAIRARQSQDSDQRARWEREAALLDAEIDKYYDQILDAVASSQIPDAEASSDIPDAEASSEIPDAVASSQILRVGYFARRNQAAKAFEVLRETWKDSKPLLVVTACRQVMAAPNVDAEMAAEVEKILHAIFGAHADGKEPETRLVALSALAALEELYLQASRYQDALGVMREMVKRSDNPAGSLNNIANILAAKRPDVSDSQLAADAKEALASIEKAIELAGPNIIFRDTMTLALLAVGNTEAALKNAEGLLEEQPPQLDPSRDKALAIRWGKYYFHLAMARKANGDTQGAREAFAYARDRLGLTRDDVLELERGAFDELAK